MEKKVFSHEVMPLVKELLEGGQDVLLTVSGTSMRPFYKNQTTVVKLRYPKEELKKYDVVLYQDHHQYKLHRIYKVHDHVYTIYGDALSEQETIRFEQIFGVVVEHREGKRVIKKDQSWYMFNVRIWALLKPFRRILLRLFGG
jgi:hypothetical protein